MTLQNDRLKLNSKVKVPIMINLFMDVSKKTSIYGYFITPIWAASSFLKILSVDYDLISGCTPIPFVH